MGCTIHPKLVILKYNDKEYSCCKLIGKLVRLLQTKRVLSINCIYNNAYKIMLTSIHTFIGLYYIIAGTLGGSVGTALSVSTRFELGMPGYVLINDNFHEYNV